MYNIYTKTNNQNDPEPPAVAVNAVKPKLDKYVDPTGEMPTGKFKFEMWLVKHKVKIYKSTVTGLIIFSILSWGFSLWQWGDYLIFGIEQDNLLAQDLSRFPNSTVWNEHFSPIPLDIVKAGNLASSAKKIDLYATIANSNERFFVSFDYFFVVNGNPTDKRSTFLLPGETRPVALLGVEAQAAGNIEVVLENIAWKRVSAHKVVNLAGWQNARLNFVVSSSSVVLPVSVDSINATAVQFDLTNNSAFGYKQADFYVALSQGGNIVGLMPLQILDFQSLTTHAVDLRSYATNLYGTEVNVYPMINIYNSAVYLSPPK